MLSSIKYVMNEAMENAYKGCEILSKNKATVLKVAAGVSAIGLIAFLGMRSVELYRTSETYRMKEAMDEIVNFSRQNPYGTYFHEPASKTCVETPAKNLLCRDVNVKCRSQEFTAEVSIPFADRDKSAVEEEFKSLFNQATFGRDIFSKYTYMGGFSLDYSAKKTSAVFCINRE